MKKDSIITAEHFIAQKQNPQKEDTLNIKVSCFTSFCVILHKETTSVSWKLLSFDFKEGDISPSPWEMIGCILAGGEIETAAKYTCPNGAVWHVIKKHTTKTKEEKKEIEKEKIGGEKWT